MGENMYRKNIKQGSLVKIVLKKNQKSGELTTGRVSKILTNRNVHTRGIKVMLTDGQVGRVQEIIKG
jgi:uncharacterized repeat protein (TIGR03833 family)